MNRDPGIYRLDELTALGYSAETLRRQVDSGDLTRLRSGWYAIRGHDEVVAGVVKKGGTLSCVSALHWLRDGAAGLGDAPKLWVPTGYTGTHFRRNRWKAGKGTPCRVPGRGDLPACRAIDSIPVALATAAGCLSAEDWIAVCDSYFNALGGAESDLVDAVGKLPPRLRDLLAGTDGRSQSGTETIVRLRLAARGFDVVVQPQIAGVGHVDLRIGRLLIECDGRQYHSDLGAYQKDRTRDRKAIVDGWITMRLTYDDIVFGWDATLQDILAVTDADRHRIRSKRALKALQRSTDAVGSEGELPSDPPDSVDR